MAKAGLTEEAVLRAAIAIADEKGLNQVTLKAIADRLRIKTPSLYTYVDGLPGLNNLLAIYGLQTLRNELAEAAVGLSGRDAVHAMGSAYLRFARKNPGLYEATQSVNKWQDERTEKLSSEVIDLVGKVLAAFPQAEKDQTHLIRMFRSICHGFASLDRNHGFGMPVSVEESFFLAIELMLAGIQSEYCENAG